MKRKYKTSVIMSHRRTIFVKSQSNTIKFGDEQLFFDFLYLSAG